MVVVEESHLSIHTWPEHGYAAVDFYTCGECTPERAHESLCADLGATRAEIIEKLLRTGYIERQRKQLRATDKGTALIGMVNACPSFRLVLASGDPSPS